MHRFCAAIAVLLLSLAQVAGADTPAATERFGGATACSRYTLCGAQTTTGACTASNARCTAANTPFSCCTGAGAGSCTGDEVTLSLEDQFIASYYATSSTATSFSCDLRTTDAPLYDTPGDTPSTIYADDGSSILSDSVRFRSVAAPMGRVWFNCSSIAGGSVTISGEVCPMLGR